MICLLIIKLEFEVSTFEITFLGNFENIPEFSILSILGTLILNGDDVEVTVPVFTPTTFVVVVKVNILPSLEIAFNLLNTGSWKLPLLYEIIASVLIPTPAKLLLATLAALPTMFNSSVIEKFGKTRSYNTVSALKVEIPALKLLW